MDNVDFANINDKCNSITLGDMYVSCQIVFYYLYKGVCAVYFALFLWVIMSVNLENV